MGETDEKKAQKYEVDENLANGPLSNRGCNDILFCLLFLANIAAVIGIGAYGFSQGHPSRLLVPYDSDGRACGMDTGVTDYPYVYLPAPGYISISICLKSCPTDTFDTSSTSNDSSANSEWQTLKYANTLSAGTTASTGVTVATFLTYTSTVKQSAAHVAMYQTKGYLGRVCMPTGSNLDYILKNVGTAFGSSTQSIEKYIADVKTAWATILGSMGFAFIVAYVYMVILRYFAGLVTWITILLYFGCLIALAILLLNKGNSWYDQGVTDNDSDLQSDGKALKICSYCIFGFTGLCLIIFLCIFNKIRQAIAIIKSAALFVAEVKSVFLVPPIITLFNMIFVAWWIIAFVFVYSVGDITGSSSGPFATVTWSKNVRYMLIYHIFGGLWINAFFGALIQFVLATACCLWYFNKPNEPHWPVKTGVIRGLTSHFGSLALGAFILAVVQFIRLVLAYIQKQVESAGQNQNTCVKYLLRCLQCYAECFERFIKFLNKNAYIQIAITGKHFCAAAKDAFMLIWTNPVKFGIISTLGNIFIFIGRIFIAGFTALIAYIILTNVSYYKTNLYSPILPTIFCAIIGYLIGTFFMSVYGMGMDTILQCVCLDEELMKKTGKNPDRCPGPLKDFFRDHGN